MEDKQKFLDENREIFGAESSSIDVDKLKPICNHHFIRKTATTVECQKCRMGLIDMGKFTIENGKLKL